MLCALLGRFLVAATVLTSLGASRADSVDPQDEFYDVVLTIGSPRTILIPPGKPTRLVLESKAEWKNKTSNVKSGDKSGGRSEIYDDDTPAFFVFEVHTHAVGVRFEPRYPFRNQIDGDYDDPEELEEDHLSTTWDGGGGGEGTIRLRRDHGLVIPNDPTESSFYTYIGNVKNYEVKALVLVRGYSDWAPVPSLANDKFEPNGTIRSDIMLTWDEFVTTMTFKASGSLQPSSSSSSTKSTLSSRSPYHTELLFKYEVYRYWFKEGDFSQASYIDGLSNMLFKKDIEVNGVRVENHFLRRDTETHRVSVKFPSFPRTNQLFAVVVTATKETPGGGEKTYHAVYSSAVTADYNMKVLPADEASGTDYDDASRFHCVRVYYTETQVLMGVLVFVGSFLVLFGHRAFGLTQAIFGVYLVSMVAYPVSVGVFSAQHALALVASAGAGLLGGLVTYLVWKLLSWPKVSVTIPALLTGAVLAMVVAHIGNSFQAQAMMNDVIFYGAVSATTGIYLVGIIGFTKTAHLLSCAILGGFTLSIALDHYMGASIKFILLNFLRRTFVPGSSSVCCQLPFQDNEEIVVIVWATTAVLSFAFQAWRESGRPAFPGQSQFQHPRLVTTSSDHQYFDDNSPNNFIRFRGSRGERANAEYFDFQDDESTPLMASGVQEDLEPSAPMEAVVSSSSQNHHQRLLESGGQIVGYIQGYGAVTSSVSPVFRASRVDLRSFVRDHREQRD